MSVQALANSILKRAFEERERITPMKLQKLLYFVYRDYLQTTGEPLFTEQFETWQYGPVLPSVYDEFKCYESNNIKKFARDAKGNVFVVDEDTPSELSKSIDKIWKKYRGYSGIELSEITHEDGSAWSKAFDAKKSVLDIEDIKNDRTE